MTREEHHARLRELGMGWLVDEVESRPLPHVASARKTPYGVRLDVQLTQTNWHHRAASDVLCLDGLVDPHAAIQARLDRLTADVADAMAAIAARHALRGKRGVL